jgi:Fe-S cluster assembly protein SufB
VVNLVTKSALVQENGTMEWVDGNLGSKINMKYPSCILKGDYAHGSMLSIAIAIGENIIQDAGAKMIHLGNHTQSTILSKSIAGMGGVVNYRGLVMHAKNIKGAKSKVECDTMILDRKSKSDTIPTNIVLNNTSSIEHEAVVSKISEKEIFYLQSRGFTRSEAREMIVMGFVEPFAKEIPMEYASEMNRLIHIEMEGDIG